MYPILERQASYRSLQCCGLQQCTRILVFWYGRILIRGSVKLTFGSVRIRIQIRFQIRIMLYSPVTDKMQTKYYFFSFLSFLAYNFLKVHLHQSLKIKSHKEVKKQQKSWFFVIFLLADARIRIREAQKQDPTLRHWFDVVRSQHPQKQGIRGAADKLWNIVPKKTWPNRLCKY